MPSIGALPERAIFPRVRPGHIGYRTYRQGERFSFVSSYAAVIERCADTGYYVGYVPGFPGAHSQGEDLADLSEKLREVIAMLLEDGESEMHAEFVGIKELVVD